MFYTFFSYNFYCLFLNGVFEDQKFWILLKFNVSVLRTYNLWVLDKIHTINFKDCSYIFFYKFYILDCIFMFKIHFNLMFSEWYVVNIDVHFSPYKYIQLF